MPKKVSVPKKMGSICSAKLSEIGKVIDAQMYYLKKMKEPNRLLLSAQLELMEEYEPKCKRSFSEAVEEVITNVLTEIKSKCVPLPTAEEIIKCTEDIQKKNPIIFFEDTKNAVISEEIKKEQEKTFFEMMRMKYEGTGEGEERIPQEAIERNIWKEMFA